MRLRGAALPWSWPRSAASNRAAAAVKKISESPFFCPAYLSAILPFLDSGRFDGARSRPARFSLLERFGNQGLLTAAFRP